jgi:hypothetical protein
MVAAMSFPSPSASIQQIGRLARRVLAVGALALLPACFSPAPDRPTEVVLKSGKVLVGEVRGIKGGILDFVAADGEELPLPRTHVRAVEGNGPHADPALFWRKIARGGAQPPDDFVRTAHHADGTGSLDVGVAAYEQPGSGRRVYLVGAVHVAHIETFAAQQSLLDSMDLVLWEGVGASEKPEPEVLERFDVLFKSQVMLKNVLDLDFQLEQIDYERSFWRNSDMSINEVEAALTERGLPLIPNEEVFRAVFGTLFKLVDPESIPRNPTVGKMYRASIAPLMADIDAVMDQAGSRGLKEVLIELRNEVVIEDLVDVLAEPGPERIGVYYGAAHLPGMDRALRDEMGLDYLGVHWIPAWRY